jgi:lipopolysaccharide transport system permease protein
MMEAASQPAPRVIDAGRGRWFPSLAELARYRDLIYYLARREVAARYAQSAVGIFWAILQPILFAAVFSLFLGHLGNIPSLPGIPYPVFVVSGMVLWLFISGAVTAASGSTVTNEAMISKIYFPRVIIPFTYLFPSLVDLFFGVLVVVATMLLWGVAFHPQVVLLPAIFLLAFGLVLGISLWLSAINVKYRDVHQAVPFLIMVGLFVSPVIYPTTLIPPNFHVLYALNPVAGLFESFRWALFAADTSVGICLIPVAECILLVVTGAAYFQRAERTFADVI